MFENPIDSCNRLRKSKSSKVKANHKISAGSTTNVAKEKHNRLLAINNVSNERCVYMLNTANDRNL